MKKFCLIFVLFFFVNGCGIYGAIKSDPDPTSANLQAADYGPSPMDYQEKIKKHFHSTLVNPVGLIVECGNPRNGWLKVAKEPNSSFPGAHGYKVIYGWYVCGFLNAQNRMGGYSGRELYFAFFQDGELVASNWGTPAWQICRDNIPRP